MRINYQFRIGLLVIMCLAVSVVNLGAVQSDPYFFTIQIASFQQRQLAKAAAQKLKAAQQDAFFRSKKVEGKGAWYRLYLNRYASMPAARAGVKQLRQQGIISDAYIRRIPIATKENFEADQKVKAPLTMRAETTVRVPKTGATSQKQTRGEHTQRIGRAKEESAGITIKNVVYQIGDKRTDAALIYADGYFWPSVHQSQNGNGSSILVSVDKVAHFEKMAATTHANGQYIKTGTVQYNPRKHTIILNLDLPASDSYTLTQSFNQVDNVFALVFSNE